MVSVDVRVLGVGSVWVLDFGFGFWSLGYSVCTLGCATERTQRNFAPCSSSDELLYYSASFLDTR